MYKIPCVSCEKCYIGETGRKFDTRLKEHKTEVETITSKPFARNQRASKSVWAEQISSDWPCILWQPCD